jgi:hypothetical protein
MNVGTKFDSVVVIFLKQLELGDWFRGILKGWQRCGWVDSGAKDWGKEKFLDNKKCPQRMIILEVDLSRGGEGAEAWRREQTR